MKKKLLIILLLILFILAYAIRIEGFNVISYIYDTSTQNAWGAAVVKTGVFGFWRDYKDSLDYLPLAVIVDAIIKSCANLFNTTHEGFVWAVKIFNTLADTGFSLGVYYLFRRKLNFSKLKSVFIALLFFASPALIYISNYWAQIDGLVVFLVSLSVYFFFYQSKRINHYIISGGFLAVALSIKLQGAMFIPIYLLFLILIRDRRGVINFFIGAASVFTLINLPFLLVNSQRTEFVFMQPFLRGDVISNGAATFWTMFPQISKPTDVLISIGSVNLTVESLGTIILGVVLIVLLLLTWKKYHKDFSKQITEVGLKTFIDLMIIMNTTYYLFMMKMHSRYEHFAVLVSIISVAMMKKSKARTIQIILTIIYICFYTLNQVSVHYWGYQDYFPKIISDMARNNVISILMVIAGLIYLFWMVIYFIISGRKTKLKKAI